MKLVSFQEGLKFFCEITMINTSKKAETTEKQYQDCLDHVRTEGHEKLGVMSSFAWGDDPKRLAFTFSRYKFVAKMFSGKENILEVGCADAFATRIVIQDVKNLTAIDFDPLFISDAQARMSSKWPFKCFQHDMLKGPVPGQFDGAYSLDVLEHIQPKDEDLFLRNMALSLKPQGAVIVGMPSLESQEYASKLSKEGHVNCKTMPDFREKMLEHFENVFMFSMNDEVVHTGFHKMANYLIALGCGRKY